MSGKLKIGQRQLDLWHRLQTHNMRFSVISAGTQCHFKTLRKILKKKKKRMIPALI
jgi:hypothetical protein